MTVPPSASPALGARDHDHRDLWDALCGHVRLVVEDPAEVLAVGEDLGFGRIGASKIEVPNILVNLV